MGRQQLLLNLKNCQKLEGGWHNFKNLIFFRGVIPPERMALKSYVNLLVGGMDTTIAGSASNGSNCSDLSPRGCRIMNFNLDGLLSF